MKGGFTVHSTEVTPGHYDPNISGDIRATVFNGKGR